MRNSIEVRVELLEDRRLLSAAHGVLTMAPQCVDAGESNAAVRHSARTARQSVAAAVPNLVGHWTGTVDVSAYGIAVPVTVNITSQGTRLGRDVICGSTLSS